MQVKIDTSSLGSTKWYQYAVRFLLGGLITAAAGLIANNLAPSNPKESGIFTSLPPGAFTAVLAGKNGGIGIGLVEVYSLK